MRGVASYATRAEGGGCKDQITGSIDHSGCGVIELLGRCLLGWIFLVRRSKNLLGECWFPTKHPQSPFVDISASPTLNMIIGDYI
jgi:hypothetical protein